jgi:hypothetical protein
MEVKHCLGTRISYCAFDHMLIPNLLMKQGLDSLGSGSSTISLSIVQRNSATITYHLRVGYIEVLLGTLLAKCADNEGMFNIYGFIYIISWT